MKFSDTSATVSPTLLTDNNPAGIYQWTVSFLGSGGVSIPFQVTNAAASSTAAAQLSPAPSQPLAVAQFSSTQYPQTQPFGSLPPPSFNTSVTTPMTTQLMANERSVQTSFVSQDPVSSAIRSINGNTNPSTIYRNGFVDPPSLVLSETDREQCAMLVEALSNVGSTSHWRAGVNLAPVNGYYPPLKSGTPIATFNQAGLYPLNGELDPSTPGTTGEAHSAIFLAYIYDSSGQVIGMTILEQYLNHPTSIGTRIFSNERYVYSTIQGG